MPLCTNSEVGFDQTMPLLREYAFGATLGTQRGSGIVVMHSAKQELWLDLVEVSPNADRLVVRNMDFGKFFCLMKRKQRKPPKSPKRLGNKITSSDG